MRFFCRRQGSLCQKQCRNHCHRMQHRSGTNTQERHNHSLQHGGLICQIRWRIMLIGSIRRTRFHFRRIRMQRGDHTVFQRPPDAPPEGGSGGTTNTSQITANSANAFNASTNPPNTATAKQPACARELSYDTLSQQLQFLSEVMLRLTSRKKGSKDETDYFSPLWLDEELPE